MEERFYALYEEGRKSGAPQSYIDYFKARKFIFDELALLKQKAISLVPEERSIHITDDMDVDDYDAATEQDIGYNACREQTITNLTEKL